MSKLVYSPRVEVESALQGKDGLGYEHFHWFEVRRGAGGNAVFFGLAAGEPLVLFWGQALWHSNARGCMPMRRVTVSSNLYGALHIYKFSAHLESAGRARR